MSERVTVDYCKHSIPDWVEDVDCRVCHQKASHKIEEVSGPETFHPLTAYLCCGCFEMVVRYDCSTYPYDVDATRPWRPPTDPGSDPARKSGGPIA